jgi:hypothetical protein
VQGNSAVRDLSTDRDVFVVVLSPNNMELDEGGWDGDGVGDIGGRDESETASASTLQEIDMILEFVFLMFNANPWS